MAPHYLTTATCLIVVVLFIDEVTSNSVFKLRVKRDKRPTGTPISLPIQSTSTDDVFLGGTGSIGSGFIQTNFDESSLTKLQVPGISPPTTSASPPSFEDDDESLTTLKVPGVSRPTFTSTDFDESSLTRLQVPGVSSPNVGAFSPISDDESLTKLQVPGLSRPNTGSFSSNLDEDSLTQLQVPGIARPNTNGFSPITSDNASGKRQVTTSPRSVGGKFSSVDVDDAEVKEVAAFVTTALSKKEGRLRLIKIVEAESQDVAGKNYKLTLRLKNLSEDDGKHLLCQVVVFDQSWTNTRILRESECSSTKAISTSDDISLGETSPFSISFPPNGVTDASLTKRQTPSTPRPIGGGYSTIDVDDDVKEIALFAGTAITGKRNAGPAKVTKIVKAESQIVAGTNFKLTLELNQPSAVVEKHIICDVVVFDQPWTKTRLLSEYSCKQNKNPSITTDSLVLSGKSKNTGSSSISGTDAIPKRETIGTANPLSAKYSSIDVDDPDVKEVADFAMKVANTAAATSGHSAPVKLVKISKAEWQVVDAVSRNFKLTLELDDGAEESLLCVVSVFEESTWKNNSSWTNTRTLSESTCFATRKRA